MPSRRSRAGASAHGGPGIGVGGPAYNPSSEFAWDDARPDALSLLRRCPPLGPRDTDFSVTAGLQPALLAALLDARAEAGSASALFAITPTGREAEALRTALAALVPAAEILEFPAWETLPHERLSPSAETVGKRIHALRRLRGWTGERPLIVVGAVRAALQPLASDLADLEPVTLTLGGRGVGLTELTERLPHLAYARVDMVTRRGEYAVRGGILDVFPPTAEHPVRVDFFGDEVDAMRMFSVADQRSLPDEVRTVELPASRELLLGPAVRQRAAEMVHEFPSLSGMLAKIAEGIPVEGMESLTPALVDRLVPVTAFLPKDAAVAVISPERVASRAVDLAETNREFLTAAWSAATAGAQAPIDLAAGDFLTLNALRETADGRPWWTFTSFQTGPDDEGGREEDGYVRVRGEAVPVAQGARRSTTSPPGSAPAGRSRSPRRAPACSSAAATCSRSASSLVASSTSSPRTPSPGSPTSFRRASTPASSRRTPSSPSSASGSSSAAPPATTPAR
ncbi:hypothetical protein GCM10025866_06070 [Naasia aerilata]|uniref:UvrB interaction domain-containing protein n=1 Tax=Naasia aerilata TaxID=1162966 RepID=A0ABN6XIF7_9MICO|nr:hypothetical protein GCM10025866_06070 [Naasia aerilata]